MPTTLTELGSDHHTRRNQRARLFEGPDADETTVSYISDGMVIIEHLSARTGDIIRTCKFSVQTGDINPSLRSHVSSHNSKTIPRTHTKFGTFVRDSIARVQSKFQVAGANRSTSASARNRRYILYVFKPFNRVSDTTNR